MAEPGLVVVGGGPAGLAVAIRARLAGLGVAVIERMRPPVDRACGEGLLPDTWAQLQTMGVAVDERERAPFRGIRYLCDGAVAEGRFGSRPGWGVRRTALHAAMTRRAEELGADLRWGTTADGLHEHGVRVGSEVIPASLVVGADGRDSQVGRWAGLEGRRRPNERHGVRRHFAVEPWSDLVEVTWADRAEAYVTPVGPRLVGVALLWSGAPTVFDALLQRFPELARRVAGAETASRDRGGTGFGSRPRAVVGARVALVGDAAGGVDPITGEGLALAAWEAGALVDAVVAGEVERYARAHRRIVRVPRLMSRTLLLLERSSRLRRGAVAALAADGRLFDRLLAFHTRALPAHRLGLAALLRLLLRSLAGAGPATTPGVA